MRKINIVFIVFIISSLCLLSCARIKEFNITEPLEKIEPNYKRAKLQLKDGKKIEGKDPVFSKDSLNVDTIRFSMSRRYKKSQNAFLNLNNKRVLFSFPQVSMTLNTCRIDLINVNF